MSAKTAKETPAWYQQLPFSKVNYLLFGAGILLLVLGYVMMGLSSLNSVTALTISPIILLIAYLVVFPLAILYRPKK